jgi:hypothetical protein
MSPQQLGDEGEKIIFGGIGQSATQGAIGKGQCPLCHGFQQGFLSERAPNLFGIPDRAAERLKEPNYHMNDPAARPSEQKKHSQVQALPQTVKSILRNLMHVLVVMSCQVLVSKVQMTQ